LLAFAGAVLTGEIAQCVLHDFRGDGAIRGIRGRDGLREETRDGDRGIRQHALAEFLGLRREEAHHEDGDGETSQYRVRTNPKRDGEPAHPGFDSCFRARLLSAKPPAIADGE
jgi:hypothetical protein